MFNACTFETLEKRNRSEVRQVPQLRSPSVVRRSNRAPVQEFETRNWLFLYFLLVSATGELDPLSTGPRGSAVRRTRTPRIEMVMIASVLLVALAAVTAGASPLTYHQGGYNQLQVALSGQTPMPANCSLMLDQLEVSAVLIIFYLNFFSRFLCPSKR